MAAEKVDVSLSIVQVGSTTSSQQKLNVEIGIKLTKQGKTWDIQRSGEQFNNLQRTLEKEFSGVLAVPALPILPSSPSDPLDPLQAYLSAILNHTSIRTSDCLKKFAESPADKASKASRSSKKGPLTLKDGKPKKYETTVENRVLYCVGSHGACEVAMLLDNCEVSAEDECGFTISARSSKETSKKRHTFLGISSPTSSHPTNAHSFVASSQKDKDEWVEVITAASQVFKEATFTVNGRLTVEVVEGRNLAPKDFHLIRANTSDPYVVLRVERQQSRTRTIDRNLNPVWSEEFCFEITQNQGILFVLLYDEDKLSRNDSMGQVVVPLSGLPCGVLQDVWLPVLPRKPNEKISGEVRLRMKYDFVKEEAPAVMGPIFGMNLQEICDNPRLCANGIPKFYSKFLAHLEANAMNETGIFRISGAFSHVKEIKKQVDEGKEINFANYEVHSIAGALKLYMRELPVPLLTYENYNKLIELTTISSEKQMLQELKMVLVVIPPAHVDMLKVLLPSLKRFSENSKENMMTTSNLAIVFGPSLIRPQVDNFETVLHTVNISTLTALLIEHNDKSLNPTKRGSLAYKGKKTKNYACFVENRVLYCINDKGKCEVAVLLDGCEVTPATDHHHTAFVLDTSNAREVTADVKRRRSLITGRVLLPTEYTFTAQTPAERDDWVTAIRAASKVRQENTFKVSGQLYVEVVEGRNLAAKDVRLIRANSSDPYVILRIDKQQHRTRTVKKSLNPKWNELFLFDISEQSGILFVMIWDEDLMRSDSMGQVVFPLTSLKPKEKRDLWLPVLPKRPHEKISGEIRLIMSYEYIKEESSEPSGPIFGMNLQEICFENPELCENGIPRFFVQILNYLETKAINEEGIFRISGSVKTVREYKQLIDEGKDIDFDAKPEVHSLAGVLKLFLRELPVPIFTYENYSKLLDISNISVEKEMMQELKMLMVVLPPAHVDVLKLLLPSLKRISNNSAVNMMTVSNLAVVFGPSLIRPQIDSFETVLHSSAITNLTSILIEHNIDFFK